MESIVARTEDVFFVLDLGERNFSFYVVGGKKGIVCSAWSSGMIFSLAVISLFFFKYNFLEFYRLPFLYFVNIHGGLKIF